MPGSVPFRRFRAWGGVLRHFPAAPALPGGFPPAGSHFIYCQLIYSVSILIIPMIPRRVKRILVPRGVQLFRHFLWIFLVTAATKAVSPGGVWAERSPLCGDVRGAFYPGRFFFLQKKRPTHLLRWSGGGGDGSRTHVRKEFSVGVSGCRRSTTFPPRHAGRQANALVAS